MVGKFCISLDFEKKWGVFDRYMPGYDENIRSVENVIDKLLLIFQKYKIRCTWAFVGCLLAEDYEILKGFLDSSDFLSYKNRSLHPKQYVEKGSYDRSLLSGLPELRKIAISDGQELASHSFYHTYFNESGLSCLALKADMELFDFYSESILGIKCRGIVFPRNQVPDNLTHMEYEYYRSNLDNIFDKGYNESELNYFNRLLRLVDSYFPLRGKRSCKPYLDSGSKLAIPASRFLRPVTRYNIFNALHVARVKLEMTWAAKNNDFYHLWWHPHNFGHLSDDNFKWLIKILEHYKYLEEKYGMESVNMNDIYLSFCESQS